MRKLNVNRGSRIGEGWRESFTTANDKSTGFGKSSRTDDVQVQDLFLLVKLLLQNKGIACTEGCYCVRCQMMKYAKTKF